MKNSKLKSSTMWMSFISLLIILLIVVLKLSWAVGIAMSLVAIPTVYVTGNKAINYRHGPEGGQNNPTNQT